MPPVASSASSPGDDPLPGGLGGIYREIFYASFEAMLLSENGELLEANAAAARLFGCTRDELLRSSLPERVAAESIPAASAALATNRESRYELYLVRQDGTRFHAEAEGKPLPYTGRNLRLTILRDTTERRQHAATLQDSRVKLRLALAMARLGQWELDLATNVFTFDDNFLRLLGTSAQREGGHTMKAEDYARRFVPPEESSLVGREIAASIATTDPGYQRQLEHRFFRADGTPGVMLVHIAIVKDAAGRTVRTYGVNQDITERKAAEQQRIRLEEQLQQAQKMEALGTLAGGIAHDFNNILTGILGHLQLVEMDLPTEHPSRRSLVEATKAGRRARELVGRILAFTRRSEHDRRTLALGPVVQEALQLLRASLPSTIEIRTVVDANTPPVLCDAAQIHQVVMNLGTNAAHAMRAHGGVLTVSVGPVIPTPTLRRHHPQVLPGHTIRLSVRDSGCGMEPGVIKRIFEPFYTTKESGEGTGLGLTMVYSIVQNHQGAIVVESEPGCGTTFDLYFPPAAGIAPPRLPSASPHTAPPFGRSRTIMLVDDDDDVRSVGEVMLRRLGFAPLVFGNPVQALEAFRRAPSEVCAVVSDLTMPGMTGVELAQQLFLTRPAVPLLITSGYLDQRTQAAARACGVDHVIRKPFELDDLATQLRAVLKEPD